MRNLYVAVLFICLSCTVEEIDLKDIRIDFKENQFDIFVDGFLSNEEDFCQVKVTKFIDGVTDQIEFEQVSSARVTLFFQEKEIEFSYNDSLQTYMSDFSVKGIPNVEYTLKIDFDGKTYTAKEQMPAFRENLITAPFTETESYNDEGDLQSAGNDFIELSIAKHNFGYNDFILWQWVESRSSVIPDLNLYEAMQRNPFTVYSHSNALPQGVFPGRFATSGVSGNVADSIEIIQSFVSNEYKKYLISVFNETDWRTSIFSTVWGNTESNLSNGATGYFYALNVKRHRNTFSEFVSK